MYHIVWGTKYRRKVLKEYTKKDLIQSVKKVQRKYPTWYVHELNIDEDHIHVVIEIPPKDSISKVVQEIKVQSSKDLRRGISTWIGYIKKWGYGKLDISYQRWG